MLFEAAADVYGDRLLGVILTGGNQDGASGLAAVHRAGGLAVVQQPESALVPLMPASALARTPASEVLGLDHIARLLATLPTRASR